MRQNTTDLQKQYAILKAKGLQQREIAKRLGVSEQTISNWAKNLPISHYITIRDGIQKRLKTLVSNPETPIMEIYNLSNALTAIQKTIDNYYKITAKCVSKM